MFGAFVNCSKTFLPSLTRAQHTITQNNTQQRYNTRVHKISNVPVVYMALILYGTRFARCHFRAGKKFRFSGPIPSNAPRNDVARLKNITYSAI